MRKLFQLTLLILISLALSGCRTVSLGAGRLRDSGNVTAETREIGAFATMLLAH